MTGLNLEVYACFVGPRLVVRRAATAALFALCLFATSRAASADPSLIDASNQPIVLIQHSQPITIQTWDRPQISVDAGGEPPIVQRRPGRSAPGLSPNAPYSVPIPAVSVPAPDGQPVTLGPEEFPVQIPPGAHDTLRIQVPPAQSTVYVPADTAVLSINGTGGTRIENYHGQLIAQQRAGPLVLHNVSGDAFVQNLRGQIFVVDSQFDRLRTRTALNNMIFQRCDVKQIEATSDRGSIVYNNGSFQPGLARFETVSGHVALGVNGGANIAVKGQPGQIYQNFDRPSEFNDRNGEASARVGGGGPLVNVVTRQGRVYLYDGSLMTRRQLPAHWGQVRAPLERARQQHEVAPPSYRRPP
jgi:hypothetical protein